MFYDKELKLFTSTGQFNNKQLWIKGEDEYLKTIDCDVQPYSKELAYKDYGYDIDVKYRVFCDPDVDLVMGMTVEYLNEKLKVIKIVKWDDYWDVLLDG